MSYIPSDGWDPMLVLDWWMGSAQKGEGPSRFCLSHLTPTCLPTLPNVEHGRSWLGLCHSQQCLTKIQRPWAQNELQEVTVRNSKKPILPWVQANPGIQCTKGLLILHAWRYLKPCWLYAVCAGCVLGRAVGPDHVQKSLPTTLMHSFHEPK